MNRFPRLLTMAALITVTACTAESTPVTLHQVDQHLAAQALQAQAVQSQALESPDGRTAGAPVKAAAARARTASKKPKLGIADITPMGEKSEKVGVGFPIIVTFDRDVRQRAAAEAVLRVEADKPVEGAWRWVSARKVVYRTKTYWKPNQKVLFKALLNEIPGNEAAKNVSRRFAVGPANISRRRHP